MSLRYYILIALIFTIACKNSKEVSKDLYNENANNLVEQILKNDSCNCILETTNESFIATSKIVNPHYHIEEFVIRKLYLRNKSELKTLEARAKKFKLDSNMIKKIGISFVKTSDLIP